ncbi:MAG: extracellular solute-binding protein [Lachnospirales bacterium]
MKKNVIKRFVAFGLSVVMISGITGCDSVGLKPSQDGGDVTAKPEKIKLMADTILEEANGLPQFCEEYEKQTGIKLEVEKPDHAKYYEKVTLSFAAEQPADVIEMGTTYYPELANSQAIWNMTEAWEGTPEDNEADWTNRTKVKKIIDEQYVDALRMDVTVPVYDEEGKPITDALRTPKTEVKKQQLYGFPMAAGNGSITYVRKDWLDQLGLDEPKTYDEFVNMLQAFKDNAGVGMIPKGVIPLTAAGLINSDSPYDMYMREFYQDANPDFYKDPETGKYVDGFAQPEMAEAIERLRDCYSKGLIDAEVVTNKTSTCRDKVGQGLVGTFNYWAGMWSKKLNKSLNRGELIPISPIKEMKSLNNKGEWVSGYTERVPSALAISVYAQNKNAIFDKFLMYSHDGGEGQMLFTRGVEGVHYEWTDDTHTKAEALPYLSNEKTLVEKTIYAPELTITTWNDPIEIDKAVKESLDTFREYRCFASVPIVTDTVAENLADLNVVKQQVIAEAVTGKITVEEAINQYLTEGEFYYTEILNDLNGSSNDTGDTE